MQELSQWIREHNKRLVVVVSGQLRSASENADSLKRQLLSRCEHIVMVQCPPNELHEAKASYATDYVDGWDPPGLPFALKYAWPVWGDGGGWARRVKPSFYYQLCRQFRVVRKFAALINEQSDVFLRWRPDLFLFQPILVDESGFGRALHLPYCDNWGGYNDQCAIGSWKVMQRYFNRLQTLGEYLRAGGNIHPETFLKWSMRCVEVKRMRICCVLNRGSGLTGPVHCFPAQGDLIDQLNKQDFLKHGVGFLDAPVEENVTHVPEKRFRAFVGKCWQRVITRALPTAEQLSR